MFEAISEVLNEEVLLRPIIVQFQNSEVQKGEEKRLQAFVCKDAKNSRFVAAASKEILYTGKIKKDDLYNRFLLVNNKKTGKVRLIAVDTAVLKPTFKETGTTTTDNLDSTEYKESSNKLNKQFGSKKVKRLTEQRERLQMNVEDVKDQLERTVAAVELDESLPLTTQSLENDSLYRPKIHREAAVKEQVYVVEELVPETVLESLGQEIVNIDSLDLCSFIGNYMQEPSVSTDGKKCSLLLYINYLIKFVQTPVKNITKKYSLCNSIEVDGHILDNFSVTSGNSRTRPLSMKDKAVCFILVLAMIAFNYELDFEALAKDVKIGVKKLLEMGRILAFSPHGKDKKSMVLKIPLPAAVSMSPKKRKK